MQGKKLNPVKQDWIRLEYSRQKITEAQKVKKREED